jgi:hypothetical protein
MVIGRRAVLNVGEYGGFKLAIDHAKLLRNDYSPSTASVPLMLRLFLRPYISSNASQYFFLCGELPEVRWISLRKRFISVSSKYEIVAQDLGGF